jgi:N-methylhydantoinase B
MVSAADLDTRVVDPITFEILSHRLHQIAREIGVTLERVGGTVNTTQMQDYMTALYRANGDIIATGNSTGWHVACASFAVKRIIERFADDDGIDPGDVYLLNDPYVAAIHQSDVYIICPIHVEERLVAWSATFVHVMDIGAMSPGGNSPGATEICHEGVRIPGIKLIERGKLRRDVFDAICNMTRQPAMVGLDLKCEIAANNVARARMQEMCLQYGTDLVDAVSGEMIRYSEEILRRRLREIPDGSWRANGLVQTTDTWKVMVRLTKTGDHLLFDFTGTDPQASVGINLPYHATFGACFGAVQSLLGYDIPKNHGAFGPIEVIAPPGTILNVRPPAPVSLNTTSGGAMAKYLADAVLTQMAATSDKWRDEVMAKSVGGRRGRHSGVNQYGGYYVSSFGGISGSGGRAIGDGVDSGGATLTSHNLEWVESSFPLLYLYRQHIQDGGGAGTFRGGVGEEVAVILHDAPEGKIKCVAYGVAGAKNSGQGLFGGHPGAPSRIGVVEGTRVQEIMSQNTAPVDLARIGGERKALGYTEFQLGAADVFYLASGSGGGYGDPLARDPALVADDVARQLVSPAAARNLYGVVLEDGAVDETATELTRRQRRASRLAGAAAPDLAAQGTAAADGLVPVHPLRANLGIARAGDSRWIACNTCGHALCPADEPWEAACARVTLPTGAAGPALESLVGFVFQQLCCPGCGTAFDSEIVEAASAGAPSDGAPGPA